MNCCSVLFLTKGQIQWPFSWQKCHWSNTKFLFFVDFFFRKKIKLPFFANRTHFKCHQESSVWQMDEDRITLWFICSLHQESKHLSPCVLQIFFIYIREMLAGLNRNQKRNLKTGIYLIIYLKSVIQHIITIIFCLTRNTRATWHFTVFTDCCHTGLF